MTYQEFEDKLYQYFLDKAAEKGWYFAMRKGHKARRLRGTENSGYIATSFWEMTSTAGIKHVPTIALILHQRNKKLGYYWELRQIRTPADEANQATLALVEKIEEANQWRSDDVKLSKPTSKFLDVSIHRYHTGYDNFEGLTNALSVELERFIPEVDNIIREVGQSFPGGDARRITKSDLEEGQANYAGNVERAARNQSARLEAQLSESVLTVEEWIEILTDDDITRQEDLKILQVFYDQPNHAGHSFEIDKILYPERSVGANGGINSVLSAFSRRIEKRSGLEIIRHENKGETKGYFRILFDVQRDDAGWNLTMRPNLATAIAELNLNTTPPIPVNTRSLNQIFYGPPGTGKTYRTIAEAVHITDPDFDIASTERRVLTKHFQSLVNAGRIIFTTFHQSLSYEDFVEGLKPKLDQGTEGDVQYEIKRGIFQKLNIEAAYAFHKLSKQENGFVSLDYAERFDAYLAHVQERLDEGQTIPLITKSGKGATIIGLTDRGNIQVKHDNGELVYTVSKDRQVRLDEGIPDFDHINSNIYTLFASIIGGSNASVHWAVMNAVRNFNPPTVTENEVILSTDAKAKIVKSIPSSNYRQSSAPNYVLIIDEINRGNISRIFGELITLLEPDKRLGAPEALTVTLPYSRSKFGVPPNLYLIGTMNTADRSVVALDSALRRRFRFTEVPPDPTVIERVQATRKLTISGQTFDLVNIMTAINARIAFLRDRDHLIGHSYFLKMKSAQDVAEQFTTGIIPLLAEYFYEDYGQLLTILGSGFIEETKGPKLTFPTGIKTKEFGLKEYRSYTINEFDTTSSDWEADLADALHILVGESIEPA